MTATHRSTATRILTVVAVGFFATACSAFVPGPVDPDPIPQIRPPHDEAASGWAQDDSAPPHPYGQRVYVPIYRHLKRQGTSIPVDLLVTLAVRNTDEHNPIRIESARSFDASGASLVTHIQQPIEVPPMAVHTIIATSLDIAGGSAASFLVDWSAEVPVREPLVEALMVSSHAARGISFRSVGQVLEVWDGPPSGVVTSPGGGR